MALASDTKTVRLMKLRRGSIDATVYEPVQDEGFNYTRLIILYFRNIGLILAQYACSTQAELQQRAVEYSSLFNKYDHMR